MAGFKSAQDKFNKNVNTIGDYVNDQMYKSVEAMQLNGFQAQCVNLDNNNGNNNGYEMTFDNPFEVAPEVFVVSNKITIEYLKDGRLYKSDVKYDHNENKVSITAGRGPICILAIGKAKARPNPKGR